MQCPHDSRTGGSAARWRRGISLWPILISLLIVALATFAVGSTIVAKRAIEARDRAKQNFAQASRGYDDLVLAVASNVKPAKKEVFQPALDYYQEFTKAHAGDKEMRAELAAAKFHMAALHVKMGSKEGVVAMTDGLSDLYQLSIDDSADPATFPSLQDSALKVTTPVEWFMVKGADQQYGLQLIVAINRATENYRVLAAKYPENVSFRDNYSALLRGAGLLQSQLPNGRQQSLESWLTARDVLEKLVRDQPTNKDFQVRLAESLVSAARLQRTDKENEKAAANLKRAIEVREQLVAANPDDKALKTDLTTAKRELERLQATATSSKEAPAGQSAGPPAKKNAAVAETKETPAAESKTPATDAAKPPEAGADANEKTPTDTKETPAAESSAPPTETSPPPAEDNAPPSVE